MVFVVVGLVVFVVVIVVYVFVRSDVPLKSVGFTYSYVLILFIYYCLFTVFTW